MAKVRVKVVDASTKDYECKICGETKSGYANNGQPVVDGGVCDHCNARHVIPARLKGMKAKGQDGADDYSDILEESDVEAIMDIIDEMGSKAGLEELQYILKERYHEEDSDLDYAIDHLDDEEHGHELFSEMLAKYRLSEEYAKSLDDEDVKEKDEYDAFLDSMDNPDKFKVTEITVDDDIIGNINYHTWDDGAPVMKYFERENNKFRISGPFTRKAILTLHDGETHAYVYDKEQRAWVEFYYDGDEELELEKAEDGLDFMPSNEKTRYMLLDRLRTDCEYFLGNGGGYEKVLWANSIDDQINKMHELWDILPEDGKPEWLTKEQIDEYEIKMKNYKTKNKAGDSADIQTDIEINSMLAHALVQNPSMQDDSRIQFQIGAREYDISIVVDASDVFEEFIDSYEFEETPDNMKFETHEEYIDHLISEIKEGGDLANEIAMNLNGETARLLLWI